MFVRGQGKSRLLAGSRDDSGQAQCLCYRNISHAHTVAGMSTDSIVCCGSSGCTAVYAVYNRRIYRRHLSIARGSPTPQPSPKRQSSKTRVMALTDAPTLPCVACLFASCIRGYAGTNGCTQFFHRTAGHPRRVQRIQWTLMHDSAQV